MDNEQKSKINNEDNFIEILENENKCKYNEFISSEMKSIFESRLKYYSHYLE